MTKNGLALTQEPLPCMGVMKFTIILVEASMLIITVYSVCLKYA